MDNDRFGGARLVWDNAFDFANKSKLFDPPRCNRSITWAQEELTLLCILETAHRVRDLEPAQPFLRHFQRWLENEVMRATDGTFPLLGNYARHFVDMPSSNRISMISHQYEQLLQDNDRAAVAMATKRIFDHSVEIFKRTRDPLDILMEDDLLTRFYDVVSFGKGRLFRLLCHSQPTIKILEVGAGTGGTTETILRAVSRPGNFASFGEYMFTDISSGFFPKAKERFAYAQNMKYQVLDISNDPIQQGFTEESYDVILAPNVVHATPSLKSTLANLQRLQRPGGHLVLTEMCTVLRSTNYVFGNFAGWWAGVEDGRVDEPFASTERWDHELEQVGFSGVDTAVYDAEAPYHTCVAVISQKLDRSVARKEKRHGEIGLLCGDAHNDIVQRLVEGFDSKGISCQTFSIFDTPPVEMPLISTLDLESPFLENISDEHYEAFQKLVAHCNNDTIMLWMLPPTQIHCQDPSSAQSLDVSRAIRAESASQWMTLEISPLEPRFSDLVHEVWERTVIQDASDILEPDKEFAIEDGEIKIGRYIHFDGLQELAACQSDRKQFMLNSDASYLLTGGLGGLGRSVSTWLIERGARSLVFLSRSADSEEHREFVDELNSTGCCITIIEDRAESCSDIQEAIARSPTPVRGVIHLAMVLKDDALTRLSYDDWHAANSPKAGGARNLHDAFQVPDQLDFFVLASSIFSMLEKPGQANYNAANTYLESVCQSRRTKGLPCSLLNICPVSDVGFVAENPAVRKSVQAQGAYFLSETEFLNAMELAMYTSSLEMPEGGDDSARPPNRTGQVIMGVRPKNTTDVLTTEPSWHRDLRFGFYQNVVGVATDESNGSDQLDAFLQNARHDPEILARRESEAYLAEEIGRKIFDFMLKSAEDLDIAVTLSSIGMDSLMSIELCRWCKTAFETQLSVLEVMSAGTIEALGTLAARKLVASLS